MDQISRETLGTARERQLAPGLLRVLQIIVTLRFAFFLLGGVLVLIAGSNREFGHAVPYRPDHWGILILVEMFDVLLPFVVVSWPKLRQGLGRWFLPLVLVWLLGVPLASQAIFLQLSSAGRLPFDPVWASNPQAMLSWMTPLVILAVWQYGRRGFWPFMGLLALAHLVFGLLLAPDSELAWEFGFGSVARLLATFVLGWVIGYLVDAQRTEHQALQAANRQLAQRAATIEQLAESRERNRLARELHDTIAHALSGLSVQLQALGTLMKHDPDGAQAQLREAQATARNGVAESRRAIQALRATPLEDLGLAEALRQLCRQQAERTGIEIEQEIANAVVLDPLTEQSIYRVADAALSNVEDHAAATHVSLCLRQDGKNLALQIKDDGIGFDPDGVASDRFGLSGIRERAELLGAELHLESAPGKGTTVTLRV